jgi:CRISPR-associated protein Csb3
MTQITLAGCEPYTLLSHMALYGLGVILEADGVQDVRLAWDPPGNPRPVISADDLDEMELAARVGRHAQAHAARDSWVQRDVALTVRSQDKPKPATKALMSPRLSVFWDQETWELVQRSRHDALDQLVAVGGWLDLRFLAALGEPCYWSRSIKGEPLQDDGASRFEMQPRNQGSEFVGTRLRKLAGTVARRDPAKILAGLHGESVEDELDSSPGSRTATGLAGLGPTDNALAWCALWGISQFPVAMRVNGAGRTSGTAVTSGHISHRPGESFFVPMWKGQWRPARLRTVLASLQLRTAAATGLSLPKYTDTQISAAHAWLAARNVEGIMRFPVHRFGSDNAPERRAMRGEPIPVRGAR